MSVDFPNEAARCQRFLSVTPQITFDPDETADAIDGLNYSRRHWLSRYLTDVSGSQGSHLQCPLCQALLGNDVFGELAFQGQIQG
jgi:hypothetical protein